MPWMRVAIGVGGGGLVAGVAGMVVWIDGGSHYFDLAVALAMAGFGTLVACVLTRVFGSSRGSQDDAFRRGRSMGYDAGFLEGHQTARPAVIPLRGVDRDVDHDLAVPFSDIDHDDELKPPPTTMPLWRRDRMPLSRRGAKDRVVGWVMASRTPLLAGALCLAVVGVLVANALVPTPVSAEALQLPPGAPFNGVVPPSSATPAPVSEPAHSVAPVAVVAGGPPIVPSGAGVSRVMPAVGAASVRPVAALSSSPGVGVVAPATAHVRAANSPVTAPAAAPVVAAPVVDSRTAAQITADNAAAAAAETARVAAAAAAETARVAAAAAAQTAATAASAAEATRLKALADAYAVAHPNG